MKALVLTDVKKLEVLEVDKPKLSNKEVLIKTAYAGICGTDHALYSGLPGSAKAIPPIVLGHENSGVVAEIGTKVTNVKIGDRVSVDPNIYCGQCRYCRTKRPELCQNLSAVGVTRNGGFAEYFSAPASVVYPIPDNVSLKTAAIIEPISCAVHGIQLLKLAAWQKALIIGDGFMGQLFVQILQAYGIYHVDLAGIIDEKLELNKTKFGVNKTFNTSKGGLIPEANYDIVIEAVGMPITQEQAIKAAARGAQVLMFGVGKPNDTFKVGTYGVFQKQLTIQGSFINPYTFVDSVALLSSDKLNVETLISHELDYETVDDFVNDKLGVVSKAVVKIGSENK
ncbi:MAG: zinc-dependent alcohol dehydrogenase family protein [Bifidobacteriaceae bacterium]|jgi:2-desacetyl-2-hydroxyethyl bacteriochlorophyllide A dehydrogenase|nr:zinc-dependent alcohol dehydrogenase family protein [Bifidobacteriaceae bacterium]